MEGPQWPETYCLNRKMTVIMQKPKHTDLSESFMETDFNSWTV